MALIGVGTNLPTSGDTITAVHVNVKMDVYDGGGGQYYATNYTVKSGSEVLLTTTGNVTDTFRPIWTGWKELAVPTGGWTWAKAKGLTIEFAEGDYHTKRVYKAQVRVKTNAVSQDVNTFYYDGHSGISSSTGWVTPTAATDPNEFSTTTTSNYTNPLTFTGTSAPDEGGTITQVRVRVKGKSSGNNSMSMEVRSGSEVLTQDYSSPASPGLAVGTTEAWSAWTTLPAPTGGWSWLKVRELTGSVHSYEGAPSQTYTASFYKAEVEVTSQPVA